MHEFLRLPQVQRAVGLSRSEIYRRIANGDFPAPRRYPDSNKTFWLSTDVVQWQAQVLGDDPLANMFD